MKESGVYLCFFEVTLTLHTGMKIWSHDKTMMVYQHFEVEIVLMSLGRAESESMRGFGGWGECVLGVNLYYDNGYLIS